MAAQEGDFDVAIQVDGDGQHPAAEINRLVAALSESGADIAIGSRFVGDAALSRPRLRGGSASRSSRASSPRSAARE